MSDQDGKKGGFADPAGTWNKRFSEPGFLFGSEPNQWLREHLVWSAGQRVLSVADGEGRNSVWLAEQGLAVEAFDISEVGLTKARKLATERGVKVQFELADCDAYAWPAERFDGVAVIFVQFADPELRARMFAHICRSLKPGGLMVLQGYTPRQLEFKTGGPPLLSHLYTADLLREAFAGLEILELQEYEAEVNEGAGHKGMSALVGMVARKPL